MISSRELVSVICAQNFTHRILRLGEGVQGEVGVSNKAKNFPSVGVSCHIIFALGFYTSTQHNKLLPKSEFYPHTRHRPSIYNIMHRYRPSSFLTLGYLYI